MVGYTYILECVDGSYYTGSTNHLESRLFQHQNGEGANYTKNRLPVKLVYFEEFDWIDEAFYREKQIQGWSRKKKEALIKGEYEKLPKLSKSKLQIAELVEASCLSENIETSAWFGGAHQPSSVTNELLLPNMIALPEPVEGNRGASTGSATRTTQLTAFPPIVNENSRVLILGTMPSEKSLALQQYYAHPSNQFWRLIYGIFGFPVAQSYEEKKQFLLSKNIALWDVLRACERKGSADSEIKNAIFNDFEAFYERYFQIKTVFLASKEVDKLYDKYVGKDKAKNYYVLPSPSSANASKSFKQKLNEWKIILEVLNN